MRFLYSGIVLLLAVAGVNAQTVPSCKPVRLRCEHLTDPLGIDNPTPRLSWQLADTRRGARQTAWQLVVGTDSAQVLAGRGDAWQTTRQPTDQTLLTYAGKPLTAFTRYYWRVQVWDKDGKASTSAVAAFETGPMKPGDWRGDWISDEFDVTEKRAPHFRRSLTISKPIRSARVYIATGGLHEVSVNGQRIGNQQLAPAFTRYDRRLLYVTYDVTAYLKAGANALGVLLGNGWYNHQSTAVWYFHKAPWRNRPTFCLDLRVTYTDGTTETIRSGNDWKTALGPVVFNSIYTGEHYDARLDLPGWDRPGFDDKSWKKATLRAAPAPTIAAQAMHPIRDVEPVAVQRMTRLNDTTYVFDLGQNIAGVSEISLDAPAGTRLRLTHAELLGADGHVDLRSLIMHYRQSDPDDRFQTDEFTLAGRGRETFRPRFNYKGFQYVEVTSNRPVTLTKESLKAYFMHSDVPTAGRISSTNPTLEKIWQATNNAYRSNLFGYPTDCPQREKNGWTGDAHIAIETGLYNYDALTVYEKWLADHRDEQQPNGVLPAIIPTSGWGYHWANGPDWTSTIALIPWTVYQFTGDTKVLTDNYEALKRYVDHLHQLAPSGLTTWGLGDWVPVKSKSPVELTSSLYYYIDAQILAEAARLLGHRADAVHYGTIARKVREAINAKYLNPATGLYGQGFQTELSAPLFWGVVPDDLRPAVAAQLSRRVLSDNNHLDVGLLGTKTLLNALIENGYANQAYRVAAQETFPSWGWWIVNGATTLYENWDMDISKDASRNHIMFGEVGAWLYKALGGIRPDASAPGFKKIRLEPHFVEGLNGFEATHESPHGQIRSAWVREGAAVRYTVTVPPNTTATLRVGNRRATENGSSLKPNADQSYRLPAGTYTLLLQ